MSRDIKEETKEVIRRAGNNIVSPGYNGGKDYIILRAVPGFNSSLASTSEPGMKQVYVAIPELPLIHAFGEKVPYPVIVNNLLIYKASKAVLHKLAYKAADDYGHYFIFDSAAAEQEVTKGVVTKMREGVLTAKGSGGKV